MYGLDKIIMQDKSKYHKIFIMHIGLQQCNSTFIKFPPVCFKS